MRNFHFLNRIVQPLLIISSLNYYRYQWDWDMPTSYINSRCTGFAVLLGLQAFLASHVRHGQLENGARLRSACASLIYRKVVEAHFFRPLIRDSEMLY